MMEQVCTNVHTEFYRIQELSQEDLELKEKVILTHPNKFSENMKIVGGAPLFFLYLFVHGHTCNSIIYVSKHACTKISKG